MVRRKSDKTRRSNYLSDKHKCDKTEVLVSKKGQSKRKFRVMQEIKHLRKTTKLVIPKLPFSRLVKEIIIDLFPRNDINRMQSSAMEALQEATEMYMVQFFEDSILLAFHCKRVTLMQRDMVLMRRLRGRDDVINR